MSARALPLTVLILCVCALWYLSTGVAQENEVEDVAQEVVEWEYLVQWDLYKLSGQALEERLNPLGQDGWEMITATPYIFKRRKISPIPSTSKDMYRWTSHATPST